MMEFGECPVGYDPKDCVKELIKELEEIGVIRIGNFCWENCLKTFFKFKSEYKIEDEGTTIVVSKSN